MVRVCFVCMGNICRSPTAEGVMRHLVKESKLSDRIAVDSAGTVAYHAGEPPDRRSAATARARNIEVDGRARQFLVSDWDEFDYVLALDEANYRDLERSAPSPQALEKLHLLRSFDPESPAKASIPDPYYGGAEGFETVLNLCEAACAGLLDHIRQQHGL